MFRQPHVLFKQAQNSQFFQSVIVLTGGTFVAQSLLILASPIITRLYSPTEVGILTLLLVFANLTSVIASMQYSIAIVSADTDEEGAYLTWVSLLMSLMVSAGSGLILYGLIVMDALGFGEIPIIASFLIIPVNLFTSCFFAIRYWHIRQGSFWLISQASIAQNLGRVVSQVGLGLFGLGSMGLVVGESIGRVAGTGRLYRSTWADLRQLIRLSDQSAIWQAMRKYYRFPVFTMPSTLINTLALTLPALLITHYYGIDSGGHFGLIQRVMALPVALIGLSVADVFHNQISRYKRENPARARPFFLQTLAVLFVLSCLGGFFIFVTGPRLFALVFGNEWEVSGQLARVMVIWFIGQLTVMPVSRVTQVFDGQAYKLIYDCFAASISFLTLAASHQLGYPLIRAVTLLSIGQAVAYVIYFFVLLKTMRPLENTGVDTNQPEAQHEPAR